MEPIAIVTAFVAALYIVGRGPLVVAPASTVESTFFAAPDLVLRIIGALNVTFGLFLAWVAFFDL